MKKEDVKVTVETGVLTIAGPTNTDGGPITLTSAGGIVVAGALGDANTGDMTLNASANNVTFNTNLTVNTGQTVTLTDGNFPGLPNQTTTFPQLMTVDYVRVFVKG